jgi:nucleotide-binding universal stress UspA family protein
MYQCRRLLVPLQLNDQDTNLIRYAGMVSRIVKPELLVFVHVVQEPDIPREILEKYPRLAQKSPDVAEQRMARCVKRYWDGPPPSKTRYEIAQGCPLRELLRCSRQHDVDLAILGRASPPTHLGQLSERMIRKAPCSVLIVPENSKARISGIMVPVDFSAHSDDALEIALALAQVSNVARVDCLHAFRVPPNYENADMPYEEFAEEMRKSSLRAFAACEAKHDTGAINLSPDVVLDRNPAHAIEESVRRNSDDLVILGARGGNTNAAILLGSVTEHLVWTTKVPLLVVRRKGANAALLKVLLGA